jgi:hypothetical protein
VNTAPVTQAAKPAAPKGQSEGIRVHGHWMIEVKNPDGKVTARREFENSVQPAGESYLAALLAGNNSPGGLSILLNGLGFSLNPANPGRYTLDFSEAGPCLPFASPGPPDSGLVQGTPATGSACVITGGANSAGYASVLGSWCYTASPASCSTNLMATAPTFTAPNLTVPVPLGGAPPGSTQIALSGSVPVTATIGGNITDVETVFTTCDANSTAGGCVNFINPTTSQQSTAHPTVLGLFTQKDLNGAVGTATAPVAYTPGQTIAVTVTISFQ